VTRAALDEGFGRRVPRAAARSRIEKWGSPAVRGKPESKLLIGMPFLQQQAVYHSVRRRTFDSKKADFVLK
jgi:hypothetical protein